MIGKRILLTTTSALMGVLVFEPFSIWPLALIAWVPFFWSLREASTRVAFYLGLLHGFIIFGITLSWFWMIFGTLAIALWGMLALFTAGFAFLVVKSPTRSPLIIAITWTGLEYFRAEIFMLSFPWITPGTGLPPNWLTPVVGVYGVSFLIVLGSSFFPTNRMAGSGVLAALLISTVTFKKVLPNSEPIKVGLIQDESGIPIFYRESSTPLANQVDILVWPEYALGFFDGKTEPMEELLSRQASVLVTGGKVKDDQDHTKWYNSAFTFQRGKLIGHHVKNHTVHLFDDGEAGSETKTTETHYGKIGTPVCFDCDHQDVVRNMTRQGANLFLVPSMDAEQWSAKQHEQHGMLFRHRAAENGRWMAVASTSGVTQVIDSHGQVRARLPLMDEGELVSEVYTMDHRTPYQMGGWLLGPTSLIGVALLIFMILGKEIRSNRPGPASQ